MTVSMSEAFIMVSHSNLRVISCLLCDKSFTNCLVLAVRWGLKDQKQCYLEQSARWRRLTMNLRRINRRRADAEIGSGLIKK
jgi:hypothetical protein